MRKILSTLAGVTIAAAATISPATAQSSYPNKPVTLVVAFTPGGPSDVLSRILGKKMSEILGQTFIIDNRPGAGGNVAAEFVARSAPDGYTLLFGTNGTMGIGPALYKNLTYDPVHDL